MRALAVLALLAGTAAASADTLELTIDGTDVHASVTGIAKPRLVELVLPGHKPVAAHTVVALLDGPIGLHIVHTHASWTQEWIDVDSLLPAGSQIAASPTPDLVTGAELAVASARNEPGLRHVVVVIGEGNSGTDVELLAISRANPDIVFTQRFETTDDDLARSLLHVLRTALVRFEARFDLSLFPHDGKIRVVQLRADGADVAAATLETPEPPPAPPPSKTWRYLVVAGVVVGFALISLLLFRSKGPR